MLTTGYGHDADLNVIRVPLDNIHDNPYQPRLHYSEESIQELAEDIFRAGLLQPPQARPNPCLPGHFHLAFGHRRLRAFKWLRENYADDPRWEKMPLIIVQRNEREFFECAMIENAQRSDLNAIEKAKAMLYYIDHFKASQVEAGRLFGLHTQGAVSNIVRLIKLPQSVQALIQTGILSELKARQLLTLSPADAVRISQGMLRFEPEDRDEYFGRELRLCRERAAGTNERSRRGRVRLLGGICPHCSKVPEKGYMPEASQWRCCECGGVVRVTIAV